MRANDPAACDAACRRLSIAQRLLPIG